MDPECEKSQFNDFTPIDDTCGGSGDVYTDLPIIAVNFVSGCGLSLPE